METLPGVVVDMTEQEGQSEEADDTYQSAEQLGAELVTLSQLPESRWKSLLHLDVIKVTPAAGLPPLVHSFPSCSALVVSEEEQTCGATCCCSGGAILPAHHTRTQAMLQGSHGNRTNTGKTAGPSSVLHS